MEAKIIMSFSVKSLFGVFALMTSTLNENGNNLLFCPAHCNDIELYPYHYEFHLNRKKVIDFRIMSIMNTFIISFVNV